MPFDISGWYLIGVNHNDSVKSTIESAGVTLGTDISLIVACAAMTRSQTENTNYEALGNLNESLPVPDISCGVVEYHADDSILGGVTTNAFGNNNWAKVLDADASFVLSPYPSVGVWCLIEKLPVSGSPAASPAAVGMTNDNVIIISNASHTIALYPVTGYVSGDLIGAYVGSELRGLQQIQFATGNSGFFTMPTNRNNDNEVISKFVIYRFDSGTGGLDATGSGRTLYIDATSMNITLVGNETTDGGFTIPTF